MTTDIRYGFVPPGHQAIMAIQVAIAFKGHVQGAPYCICASQTAWGVRTTFYNVLNYLVLNYLRYRSP